MDFEKPNSKKSAGSSEIAPESFKNLKPDNTVEEFPKGSDWYEKQKKLILDERIDVDKIVAEAKAEVNKNTAKEEAKIISIEAARADVLKKFDDFENRKAA